MKLRESKFIPIISRCRLRMRRRIPLLRGLCFRLDNLRKSIGDETGGYGNDSDRSEDHENVNEAPPRTVFNDWVISRQMDTGVDLSNEIRRVVCVRRGLQSWSYTCTWWTC